MLLSELGSAKLRIAYRYPYGTDNFVKFLKSHKNQSESFLRAAEKITLESREFRSIVIFEKMLQESY